MTNELINYPSSKHPSDVLYTSLSDHMLHVRIYDVIHTSILFSSTCALVSLCQSLSANFTFLVVEVGCVAFVSLCGSLVFVRMQEILSRNVNLAQIVS